MKHQIAARMAGAGFWQDHTSYRLPRSDMHPLKGSPARGKGFGTDKILYDGMQRPFMIVTVHKPLVTIFTDFTDSHYPQVI